LVDDRRFNVVWLGRVTRFRVMDGIANAVACGAEKGLSFKFDWLVQSSDLFRVEKALTKHDWRETDQANFYWRMGAISRSYPNSKSRWMNDGTDGVAITVWTTFQ
jgi:hypothetical protein